jgi:mannose/fructose/N-acetylgalactosamine-specific phosphotransferase system component IIB
MAWAQVSGTSTYTVRMQRFAIPSTTSSALVPIQNAIDVLATPNAQTEEVGIVYTSPTTALAVWVDNRWGASEIYSAPINFGACP